MISYQNNMPSPDENKQLIDELNSKIARLEQRPLDDKKQQFEDIKSYDLLKVRLLHMGLPIFTSVPTYTGFQGEMVVYDSGSGLTLYSYIDGSWQSTSGVTDHGALDGLGDDDHSAIYYNKTAIDGFTVKLTGNQNVGGVKAFSSFPTTPSSAPSTNYQMANKKYVDDNTTTGGISVLMNDMTGGSETIDGTTAIEIVRYVLAGGTLGINDAIRIRAQIRTDATSWVGEVNLQIGDVDVSGESAGITIVRASGDNSQIWELDCIMKNIGAVDSQKIAGRAIQIDGTNVIFTDTKSDDTSDDVVISIDGKRDSGGTTGVLSVVHWMIELLKAP